MLKPVVLAGVLAVLSGCAIFEPYVVESKEMVSLENGAYMMEYLYESPLDGSQYFQWEVINYTDDDVCGQVDGTIESDGGARWGSVYRIPAGSKGAVGWADANDWYDMQLSYRLWTTPPYESCGYYPED